MAMQPTTSMVVTAALLSVAMVVTQAAGGAGKENYKRQTEDLVVEACKNMSHDILLNKTHFHEEPCVSVLRSDNRSMLAKDHLDLVVIALDLLDHRNNMAMARIDGILSGLKVDNWTQRAFQYCSTDYAAIVRTLPACRDMFLGLTKQWGKNIPCFVPEGDDATMALGCLDGIADAARDCYLLLAQHWDDSGADEFEYISLAWGLLEMATECRDTDSKW